jgi:hypothetical protein
MPLICFSCKEEAPRLYIDQVVANPFTVVGMRFRGNHKFKKSDNITLEFDPSNQYDKNAIKVMVDGVHRAYVAKDNNRYIGDLMRRYPKYSVEAHGNKNYNLSAKLDLVFGWETCVRCHSRLRSARDWGVCPSD